jgi:hypothetical protein
MIFLDEFTLDTFQFLFREKGKQLPSDLKGPLDAPVLISLGNELALEFIREFQVFLVKFG